MSKAWFGGLVSAGRSVAGVPFTSPRGPAWHQRRRAALRAALLCAAGLAALGFLAAAGVGCGSSLGDALDSSPDWIRAPREYKCSPEEMERVQREAQWCNENADLQRPYCYGTAIMRICTPISPPVEAPGGQR